MEADPRLGVRQAEEPSDREFSKCAACVSHSPGEALPLDLLNSETGWEL